MRAVFNVTQFLRSSATVRTRFAPSPTGFMHLGALRTALYSYAFAKHHKGEFILRIEDTDQKRTVEGSLEQIKSTLNWTHLPYDEFYVQSERFPIYQKYAHQLISSGNAYKCYCTADRLSYLKNDGEVLGRGSKYDRYCLSLTPEEIQANEINKTPFVVRMKIPEGHQISFEDKVYGKVSFRNELIDDQVLLKSDGFPTYHLANVVDDYEMKISHVIRGCEWISSTPKHILLYEMFGWNPPVFAHLPLLVNENGAKLSKRQGHSNLDWYKEKGFLPEALVNFVANLGWTSEDSDDVMSLQMIVNKFSLERVHKGNCMVNLKKLEWFNSQHIRMEIDNNIESVLKIVKPTFVDLVDEAYLVKVLRTCRDRIWNLHDFSKQFYYFFGDINVEAASEMKIKVEKIKDKERILEYFKSGFPLLKQWDHDCIDDLMNQSKTDLNATYNDIVTLIRYTVTGAQSGAGITQTLETLGRDVVMKRINNVKF
jgi:glutamyl-tRNA synthetase